MMWGQPPSAVRWRSRCFTIIIYHTKATRWCYTIRMKRATISLPDDLADAVEEYIQAQEVRPALTTLMQTALREYLSARGFLRVRRPSRMTPKGEQRPKRREPRRLSDAPKFSRNAFGIS